MRILFLITLLFTFVVGSFPDTAHAVLESHTCTHQQMDQENNAASETCHSEQDEGQCEDCCCVHSHSMVTPNAYVNAPVRISKKNTIVSLNNNYFTTLSGLRRPPRL